MKIFLILFVMLTTSCGFFTTEEGPSGQTIDPPEIERSPQGNYVYTPPESEIGEPTVALVCTRYSQVLKTITKTVEDGLISNIDKTIEKEYTFKLDPDSSVDRTLLDAEYIHIMNAEMRTASGSSLDFISWIKIDLDGRRVAWTDDPGGSFDKLKFDGSVDIRPSIRDNAIEFHARVRGSLPGHDTEITIMLEFITVRGCSDID